MTPRAPLSLAITAALCLCASIAPAATIYQVINHPAGNAIVDGDVNAAGYVLRLDMGLQQHTFNANTIDDLTLTVDTAANRLILEGHVTHNQSGSETLAADGDDDVYLLHAAFALPSLTDATPGSLWYGVNDDDAVYDNVLDDLLADSTPYTGAQTSTTYSLDTTRLSFFMVELTLTPDAANQYLGVTFPADRLTWNEFPNDSTRPLLIEYDWRMPGAGALAGGGWVESAPGARRYGSSEILFALYPQANSELLPIIAIPLPEALPLGLLGVAMINVSRRRLGF